MLVRGRGANRKQVSGVIEVAKDHERRVVVEGEQLERLGERATHRMASARRMSGTAWLGADGVGAAWSARKSERLLCIAGSQIARPLPQGIGLLDLCPAGEQLLHKQDASSRSRTVKERVATGVTRVNQAVVFVQ